MKVGVTGHQSLGAEHTYEWVKSTLKDWVASQSITRGYSSLAIGTDQLFAQLLLQASVPLVAVIPSAHYEETFSSEDDRINYQRLLRNSSEVRVLDYDGPTEEAFMAAGKAIVELSDILVAVWNGKPAAGLGGTADVVAYANERMRPVVHINPQTRTIFYI